MVMKDTRSEFDANMFLSMNDAQRDEYIEEITEESVQSLSQIIIWIVLCIIAGFFFWKI
jgi:hypothetical protein